MKKTAIILDVDGTLWDSTPIVAKAWTHGIRTKGVDDLTLTADMLKQVFGKTMAEIGAVLFSSYSSEKQYELMEGCYEFEHKYIRENDENIFYPGVEETIPLLAKEHDLFIVSNCQAGYIEVLLEKSSFAASIKDFECFGNTQKSKGENIRLLMERNNVTDAVYVGDTMGDFEASAAADVPFIFASYGFGKVEKPYKTITKFDELLTLWED